MTLIAERQQALLDALSKGSEALGLAPLHGVEGGAARGLQAYRHNAAGLAFKALAGVYGQVRDELGEKSFDAMAWAFWRAFPPTRGDLGQWGGELADFLNQQTGMDPALCDLARLEWARHAAECAADAEFDAESLALLGSVEPSKLHLQLRPGTALLAQVAGPVLVWRKGWRAEQQVLGAAEGDFTRALLDQSDLDSALAAAGESFDFSDWLQKALRESWLLAVKEVP